jgi:hypothetical protein
LSSFYFNMEKKWISACQVPIPIFDGDSVFAYTSLVLYSCLLFTNPCQNNNTVIGLIITQDIVACKTFQKKKHQMLCVSSRKRMLTREGSNQNTPYENSTQQLTFVITTQACDAAGRFPPSRLLPIDNPVSCIISSANKPVVLLCLSLCS